jgi:hypothetical protein
MLIATVPYVGKRLHLDPEPDPELNYGSGFEHANNFRSGRIRIRIHNPVYPTTLHIAHLNRARQSLSERQEMILNERIEEIKVIRTAAF